MTEPQHQALSDLLDGELDADQAEAMLDALCRDDALAAQWRRMHQIRGLMRGEADPMFDVSAAVRQALASEPAYLLPALAPRRATRHWPRYAIGGALAASVALATVVGIRQWQAPGAADQLAVATPDTTSTLPVVAISNTPTAATAPQPSRLESYWAAHADNALLAGQDSLNPLLRNVSVDSQQ